MGVCRVETDKAHRQAESFYSLNTVEGVRKLLEDFHKLKERRYGGDYAASDILIDLEEAINLADLTDQQELILYMTFYLGFNQRTISVLTNNAQSSVSNSLNNALKKICSIYVSWNYGEIYAGGDYN